MSQSPSRKHSLNKCTKIIQNTYKDIKGVKIGKDRGQIKVEVKTGAKVKKINTKSIRVNVLILEARISIKRVRKGGGIANLMISMMTKVIFVFNILFRVK